MDLHLQSCAWACRRAGACRSRPSPAPRRGLAELPPTRRPAPPALLGAGPDAQQSTATARAGGPQPPPARASPGSSTSISYSQPERKDEREELRGETELRD